MCSNCLWGWVRLGLGSFQHLSIVQAEADTNGLIRLLAIPRIIALRNANRMSSFPRTGLDFLWGRVLGGARFKGFSKICVMNKHTAEHPLL